MLDTNVNRPDFAWLNESSRIFLHRGYLLEGTEPEDRIRYIADHAEKLLDYPGFADKFYHYMARGYYSLASPIWSNFGLDRGLPISCVTGDTWINTKSGGKQAKDIVVGDMVLTHKNRYRPVTKVIPTKDKGDIYRLKIGTRMTNLHITGNHPVLTNMGWVKVEDLDKTKHLVAVNGQIEHVEKDYVIDMKEFVDYDFYVEDGFIIKKNLGVRADSPDNKYYARPCEFVELDQNLAWALGLWFAEGSLSTSVTKVDGVAKPNGIRVTLNMNDGALGERWIKTMVNKFNIVAQSYGSEIIRNGKLNSWFNINVNSVVIGKFFDSFGRGCKVKQIPEWLLSSSKENLQAFLDGILAGDGTEKRDTMSLTLSNPVLALQVYQIGLILGHDMSLQMQEKAGKLSTTPYVYIVAFRGYVNSLSRNNVRSGVKFQDGLTYCPIITLEKTDKVEDVYDFTVEEDHSFSCAGVVVHNCFGSYIGDSIYDIMSTTAEVGMMSKTGGGTSGYFGAIRPRGAPIKDNGHSDGSFNFAKLFDTVIDVISQGTSRKGQFAGYIDIEHPDIEEWLDIHKEGNPIQLMYYGVCIGDQWLKEMKEGDAEKRRIWAKVLQRKAESGIPYLFFKDNVNNQKPDVYKDKDMTIYASNLCVSGDTTILTKEYGHTPIAEHVGEFVTVWNGQEWSPNVQLVKTGENQQLYLVKLSNGREIKCTGYHKWFVKNHNDSEAVIKETLNLQEGDMLDRWSLPVMEGHLELEDAYTNGFFTGDGCRHKGTDIVYLYHEKKDLRPFITGDIRNEHYAPVEDRITLRMKGLRDKFFVPNHEYTIKSRLEWLAGYLDADGCIYRCDGSEQITASSINKDFLDDLHDMLSTLGVDSKIRILREGGRSWLPLNNGFDEYGLFQTKRVYRLLISGYESQKLLNLGLKLNRLKITQRPYNRFLNKRVMVEGVFELPDREDTYCCNEPLRHRVIFNGVNTGNCSEIALPSSLEESFVCCLSSMNALYFDEWKDTDAVETMTYFLDAVMEEFIQKSKSIPMMEKAHRFASRHRAIGIGVLGWHSYLQYKHTPFESFQAMQLNNELFKTIYDRSYAASREMAERYGEPEILKGYGRRNTTTMSVAPTKSSSFILGGVSPSVEPIRSNYYIKDLAKIKTTYRNPLLTKVLQEKGLDNEATWQSILVNDGSVQHLDGLSDEDKEVFKTWQEISQLTIIQQAAQRQKYIDQGQSINILVHPDTPTKDINQLYLTAHELGMKSIYYQFSMSAAQKFNRALLNTCTTCES